MTTITRFAIAPAALLVLAAGCAQAPDSDQATVGDAQDVQQVAEATTVSVNTDASTIEWVGTKVTGRHNGSLALSEGTLELADGGLVGGTFTIDMNSLTVLDDAGERLQGHLMSPDFFNVAENPTATFVITGAEAIETASADEEEVPEISQYKVTDPTHTISGNLTMVGVTKGISFPAKVSVDGSDVEATAKFNINRKDWNINYAGKPDDLIRDDVHLGLMLTTKAGDMAMEDHGDHGDHGDHEGHDH
jgi:polyisoprenoid-binding protein YceI